MVSVTCVVFAYEHFVVYFAAGVTCTINTYLGQLWKMIWMCCSTCMPSVQLKAMKVCSHSVMAKFPFSFFRC